MTSNPRVVFAARPEAGGIPVVGKHIIYDTSRTIDVDNVPLNGGFLTKTLVLSPEPAMHERMRDPSVTSYATTYVLGAPIVAFAVVVVLRSEKEGVNVGDYMYGMTPWEAYTVQPYIEGRVNFKKEDWAPDTFDLDSMALQVVPNPGGHYPLYKYASVLGTPGLTAFVGFEGLAEAKEGQTIFVSSGASGVGSVIIQLAKLKGLKVIASAGSDAKVEYMKSLGADHVFNYKKTSYASALKQYGPINTYWDNVGAEALDAALDALLPYGRVVVCGQSATYIVPPSERYGLKNYPLILKKRLFIKGYIVPDFLPEYLPRFFGEFPALMGQGKLRSEETVTEGWDNATQAIVDMLQSGSQGVGKPVVVVAKE